MNKVEAYIKKNTVWQKELEFLRAILQNTELTETVKWGIPVYVLNNKNIVGIAAFKSYVGLWFYQGVYLSDKHGILINAQEEKTKALRQLRFNSFTEINESILSSYIQEAIENQKLGKVVKPELNTKFEIPLELIDAFKLNPDLQSHFNELTKGRQKDFALYIQEAKRESTKLKRIEKITPMILKGVGLYDKYK